MSKADRPNRLYWIGRYDASGQAVEHFANGVPGEYDGIPARDLTPDETAALTEAQWAIIESPTGKRLYQKTKPANPPERPTPPEETPSPSASTGAPSAES